MLHTAMLLIMLRQHFNAQGVVHQYVQFAVVNNIAGYLHCCAIFRSLRGLSHSTV